MPNASAVAFDGTPAETGELSSEVTKPDSDREHVAQPVHIDYNTFEPLAENIQSLLKIHDPSGGVICLLMMGAMNGKVIHTATCLSKCLNDQTTEMRLRRVCCFLYFH